jgi:cell division protein FtsB
LTYVGERLEVREAVDQLEAILRDVAEELASWRARALKAEGELKAAGGSGARKADPDAKSRFADLESENKHLRQRVEAARTRVHDLLQRLTFLEEQARTPAGGNGGGGGGGGGASK